MQTQPNPISISIPTNTPHRSSISQKQFLSNSARSSFNSLLRKVTHPHRPSVPSSSTTHRQLSQQHETKNTHDSNNQVKEWNLEWNEEEEAAAAIASQQIT